MSIRCWCQVDVIVQNTWSQVVFPAGNTYLAWLSKSLGAWGVPKMGYAKWIKVFFVTPHESRIMCIPHYKMISYQIRPSWKLDKYQTCWRSPSEIHWQLAKGLPNSFRQRSLVPFSTITNFFFFQITSKFFNETKITRKYFGIQEFFYVKNKNCR